MFGLCFIQGKVIPLRSHYNPSSHRGEVIFPLQRVTYIFFFLTVPPITSTFAIFSSSSASSSHHSPGHFDQALSSIFCCGQLWFQNHLQSL
ncbi:Uncharacterized protein TCM_027261 [Theobroma cacao]|uniref:Uncharacterized protein n=1 Tax=Theobroma cacao TaxID=3641 RepID=A0A061G8I6_THECC|nr:Uncharacterized protein TCM_027261 [Theobroma cacao]